MTDLLIYGSGGLGREVCQYVRDINAARPTYTLLGFIDDDPARAGLAPGGVRVLGGRETLTTLKAAHDLRVFCAIADPAARADALALFARLGLRTVNIIHPTAYVPASVDMKSNILIAPLCVLTTEVRLGEGVHLNPQCGVGHDVAIDDCTTLFWQVSLGGAVRVGKRCVLGSHTFVRQNITIGDDVISGAGAVVVKDVEKGSRVMGVPARG